MIYKLPSIAIFWAQRGYNKLDRTDLQTPQYHSIFSSERIQQAWWNRFTNSPVSEYVYLVQRGHNKLDQTGLQTLQYQSMFSSERTQQVCLVQRGHGKAWSPKLTNSPAWEFTVKKKKKIFGVRLYVHLKWPTAALSRSHSCGAVGVNRLTNAQYRMISSSEIVMS